MKLVTFAVATPVGPVERIGAEAGGRIVDLAAAYAQLLHERGVEASRALADATIPDDMTTFLSRWPVGREAAEQASAWAATVPPDAIGSEGARLSYAPGKCRLRAPLRPRRIKDYLVFEAHKKKAIAERGLPMPELWYGMPTYTNRNVLGLAHPGDDIEWPSYSKRLDFEFEIAVVIGRKGRDIAAADAHAYVAGYTIYNDFSARDTQADEAAIGAGIGKSKDFDQGNVLGPRLVTADSIDAGAIDMVLRVNGEEWSRGSTRGMKFSWGEIIENAARGETIYPGDVFASGTMDGGCSLELGRWLSVGDTVEMTATGIGTLRNRVVSGRAAPVVA